MLNSVTLRNYIHAIISSGMRLYKRVNEINQIAPHARREKSDKNIAMMMIIIIVIKIPYTIHYNK
jgi:hypothetical protein